MNDATYVIRGGTVVNAGFEGLADVVVRGERIIAVTAPDEESHLGKIIDASGCYVLPGVIDTHAHIEEPFQGCQPTEDWSAGTRAACLGGTTFVFNFVLQPKSTPLAEEIARHRERASRLSCIDFNFHGVFTNPMDLGKTIAEIPQIFGMGVTSFKEFMIYTAEGLAVDDWQLLSILQEVTRCGGILGVHAENCSIGENLTKSLAAQGRTAATDWPFAKPNFVEAEAVERALRIASFCHGNIYIVHTSTKEAVETISRYKYLGNPCFLETCPHYLAYTRDRYHQLDGKYQVISPPLRETEDRQMLWTALADGRVSFIGSDHNAYGKESKDPGYEKAGFMGVANGQPGIFEILSVLHHEGVRTGRISLSRLVEVTSTNAAKLFGLFPRKGIIAPGSDADIVIFDPNKQATLGSQWYEAADTSFYGGMQVTGFPRMTFVRGRLVAEDGKMVEMQPTGRFVPALVRPGMYRGVS